MTHFIDWREHVGVRADKFYKATLWQGKHTMVGLNCLEPKQAQRPHTHEEADKFYFVLEGRGHFTVGDETREAETGTLIVAPAGVTHGVSNTGDTRLSLLVAIAPKTK